MTQTHYVDSRFVINYMNPRTAQEHRIVVKEDALEESLEYFRKRKQVVTYLPFIVVSDEDNL